MWSGRLYYWKRKDKQEKKFKKYGGWGRPPNRTCSWLHFYVDIRTIFYDGLEKKKKAKSPVRKCRGYNYNKKTK